MNEQIAYALESDKPFDTVVQNIESNVPKHQFRVLAVHNVQETLAEKGFEHGPLVIIEVCNASFAHRALSRQPDVALFMPCRYAVYGDGPKTVVKLNRPGMIAQMMPDAGLDDLAAEVEETLKTIMRESV
ncbi:MAG TPA: DUF302 domain-containing protein [Acidobacteriota bacterium]|nr:DUF302 domain-containing protein [Acidobacteriota bacterium]